MAQKETIVFIDGENFLFSVAKVLKAKGLIKHKSDIKKYSITDIVQSALKDFAVDKTKFYAGKINIPIKHPTLVPKSRLIAESQRRLKRSLINQGVEFIMAGHVRLQDTKQENGHLVGVFKEKGTDVRVAVDMLSLACDKVIDTAIIMSSDSDMQPAVKELKARGVTVVYVGFENTINAGLSKTTDKTILIRQSEVITAWHAANPQGPLTPAA